jgi:hypothetical protein
MYLTDLNPKFVVPETSMRIIQSTIQTRATSRSPPWITQDEANTVAATSVSLLIFFLFIFLVGLVYKKRSTFFKRSNGSPTSVFYTNNKDTDSYNNSNVNNNNNLLPESSAVPVNQTNDCGGNSGGMLKKASMFGDYVSAVAVDKSLIQPLLMQTILPPNMQLVTSNPRIFNKGVAPPPLSDQHFTIDYGADTGCGVKSQRQLYTNDQCYSMTEEPEFASNIVPPNIQITANDPMFSRGMPMSMLTTNGHFNQLEGRATSLANGVGHFMPSSDLFEHTEMTKKDVQVVEAASNLDMSNQLPRQIKASDLYLIEKIGKQF